MKRILSFFMAVILTATVSTVPVFAAFDTEQEPAYWMETYGAQTAEESLANFKRSTPYTQGQFQDITASAWCAENVKTVYELGLMQGATETLFQPNANLTIAQTIKVAAVLHSTFYNDEYRFEASTPWYQTYVDYAVQNGICSAYGEYTVPISRAGFVSIMEASLPNSAFEAINYVEEGAIPDLSLDNTYYNAVYRFYRAGVLTGSDAQGSFRPFGKITRGSAAAIISRMALPELRQRFELKKSTDPTQITLSAMAKSISPSAGFGLIATVSPVTAANRAITWSSSDRHVATVDSAGYVWGVAPGTAKITAKTANGLTASCTVTVIGNTNTPSGGTSRPQTSTSSPSQGQTVYITDTGSKYHRYGCRYLKKSCIPISLESAKKQGYTACRICW